MSPAQKEQLAGYLTAPNTTILSLEYPAGLSVGTTTYLKLLKVVSRLKVPTQPEATFVDYFDADGRTVSTETKP